MDSAWGICISSSKIFFHFNTIRTTLPLLNFSKGGGTEILGKEFLNKQINPEEMLSKELEYVSVEKGLLIFVLFEYEKLNKKLQSFVFKIILKCIKKR